MHRPHRHGRDRPAPALQRPRDHALTRPIQGHHPEWVRGVACAEAHPGLPTTFTDLAGRPSAETRLALVAYLLASPLSPSARQHSPALGRNLGCSCPRCLRVFAVKNRRRNEGRLACPESSHWTGSPRTPTPRFSTTKTRRARRRGWRTGAGGGFGLRVIGCRLLQIDKYIL